jgi:hypothetical protein
MTRKYVAVNPEILNCDLFESGSPRGVWNQLQKETGFDRAKLQELGWRVKEVREPKPELVASPTGPVPLTPTAEFIPEREFFPDPIVGGEYHDTLYRDSQNHPSGTMGFGLLLLVVAIVIIGFAILI